MAILHNHRIAILILPSDPPPSDILTPLYPVFFSMPAARKIIHIDCDCFYAAIEMRDHPAWRNIPLAVGGKPESRGVIATCNYPARQFGVHSAMSSHRARVLCPRLLIVPPDMPRYKEASDQIMQIYGEYTPLIEPLSLDEAYLDVTGQGHCRGSATLIAQEIRDRIYHEIGITASAGIAPNKFLAKVASDWNKPDGQKVILPQEIDAFVADLPVSLVPGIGKVTTERMKQMGILTCRDLRQLTLAELLSQFGRFGERLHQLARGEDKREVAVDQIRKSISVEETYPIDLPDLAACLQALPELLERLQARLTRTGSPPFRGIICKLKFADFTQTTVEQADSTLDHAHYTALMQMGFERGKQPVRLLGLGVKLMQTDIARPNSIQLPLFE